VNVEQQRPSLDIVLDEGVGRATLAGAFILLGIRLSYTLWWAEGHKGRNHEQPGRVKVEIRPRFGVVILKTDSG